MLFDELATVTGNVKLGPNLYLMTLKAPRTATEIKPGQFVHMMISTDPSHVLRRPFSVYAADPKRGLIDVLYQVIGNGTYEMTRWKMGTRTALIAPIGRGWQPSYDVRRALLIGGGVGAAPLFMLCEQLLKKGADVDVVLGAATADCLVCLDRYFDLDAPGLRVLYTTDDGSAGVEGFCTMLAEDALDLSIRSKKPYEYVAACGPEPMMRIAAGLARNANVPCEVSLERRMACGIGACLSCVVDTVEGKKRACVDGPVFDVQELTW